MALLATAVAGAMVPVVRKLRQRNSANGRENRRLDHDRTRAERRENATTPIGAPLTAAPTSTFR
jgi:hypothetical protein